MATLIRHERGPLTRALLAKRLAQSLGYTPDKMEEALDTVFDTIRKTLTSGGMVLIDGFGGFGPLQRLTGGPGVQTYFHPARALVDRINAEPPRHPTDDPDKPGRLPVRSEDEDLIARWLAIRRPINLRNTREVLYGPKIERPLSTTSRSIHSMALRTFARRIPVPLAKLGLTIAHGVPIISLDHAKDQVASYAEGYKARAAERWAVRHPELASNPEWTVPAWRTQGWVKLVKTASAFYTWLETEEVRPQGTNPFLGMRRFREFRLKRFRPIVQAWYNRLLSHGGLTARERAIVLLLANGLRRVEITRLRLEHLDLAHEQAVILGKGSARGLDPRPKVRTVPLLPWTLRAIQEYLEERHDSTNPRLFYSNTQDSVLVAQVARIFRDVMDRIFFAEEDAEIRREITPHHLRRYFVTESLRRGVRVDALMQATGHSSYEAMAPYIGLVEADVRKEFKRAAAEPWF